MLMSTKHTLNLCNKIRQKETIVPFPICRLGFFRRWVLIPHHNPFHWDLPSLRGGAKIPSWMEYVIMTKKYEASVGNCPSMASFPTATCLFVCTNEFGRRKRLYLQPFHEATAAALLFRCSASSQVVKPRVVRFYPVNSGHKTASFREASSFFKHNMHSKKVAASPGARLIILEGNIR